MLGFVGVFLGITEYLTQWLDDHAALPSLNYMLSQVTPTTASRPAVSYINIISYVHLQSTQ